MPKRKNPVRKKGKPQNLLTKRLSAEEMTKIMLGFHKKRIEGKSATEAGTQVKRMRKMGEGLLKRKFRDTPEQSHFVKIIFMENLRPNEKAELMIKYFEQKGKTRKQAKQEAIKTLESITEKSKKFNKNFNTAVRQFTEKLAGKHIGGEEHMFSTMGFLYAAPTLITTIKEMP